jgi:hypothetical protein
MRRIDPISTQFRQIGRLTGRRRDYSIVMNRFGGLAFRGGNAPNDLISGGAVNAPPFFLTKKGAAKFAAPSCLAAGAD